MNVVAMALALVLANTPPPLTIRVSPPRGFAPLQIRVITTVERDPANRNVSIAIDGEAVYRAFDVAIEGEAGPRTIEFTYPSRLPAGAYRISADVARSTGTHLYAAVTLDVIGGDTPGVP